MFTLFHRFTCKKYCFWHFRLLCVFEFDTPWFSCLLFERLGHPYRNGAKRSKTNPTGCWFDSDSPDQSRKILCDVIIEH